MVRRFLKSNVAHSWKLNPWRSTVKRIMQCDRHKRRGALFIDCGSWNRATHCSIFNVFLIVKLIVNSKNILYRKYWLKHCNTCTWGYQIHCYWNALKYGRIVHSGLALLRMLFCHDSKHIRSCLMYFIISFEIKTNPTSFWFLWLGCLLWFLSSSSSSFHDMKKINKVNSMCQKYSPTKNRSFLKTFLFLKFLREVLILWEFTLRIWIFILQFGPAICIHFWCGMVSNLLHNASKVYTNRWTKL